jgi:serine protease Do
VNSQILSPTGGNVGIGFAIPATVADRITKQLIENGRVVRGYLGVVIQSVSDDIAESLGLEETYGAMVTDVTDDSPADKAGFRIGDVVLELDGEKVENNLDLTRRVGDLVVGQKVRFKVLRDDRERTLRVEVGERPDDLGAVAPSTPTPSDSERFQGMTFKPMTEGDRERLDLPSDARGLVVDDLSPDSELARKGLRIGDAILEAGGEAVASIDDLEDRVESARSDGRNAVLLLVQTEGGRRFVAMPVEDKS